MPPTTLNSEEPVNSVQGSGEGWATIHQQVVLR